MTDDRSGVARSTRPGTALYWFLEDQGEVSDRKFRLFGCACVRDVWDDLPHDALAGT